MFVFFLFVLRPRFATGGRGERFGLRTSTRRGRRKENGGVWRAAGGGGRGVAGRGTFEGRASCCSPSETEGTEEAEGVFFSFPRHRVLKKRRGEKEDEEGRSRREAEEQSIEL